MAVSGGPHEPSSLLDWVTDLARDPAVRTRLADEPDVVLAEQGLANLPPADLHHSLPLVADSVAARLGTEVDATTARDTAAQHAGEAVVDALARQVIAATSIATVAAATVAAALAGDPQQPDTPPGAENHGAPDSTDAELHTDLDDLDDHDLDPPPEPTTPDRSEIRETMTMTSSTGADRLGSGDPRADLTEIFQSWLDDKAPLEVPGHHGNLTAQEAADYVLSNAGADDPLDFPDQLLTLELTVPELLAHIEHNRSHVSPHDPTASTTGESTTGAVQDTTGADADPGDLDDLDGSGEPAAGDRWVDDSEIPRWLSHDEQGRWYDNGDRSDITDDTLNPTDTPGTPQGWNTLTLEAQSHGYPDAQAYLAGVSREDLADQAWEPGDRTAAHGELQAYIDAADAAGVSSVDYGAANSYTQDQIDAADAAQDRSAEGNTDPDLDDFGSGTDTGTTDTGASDDVDDFGSGAGTGTDTGTDTGNGIDSADSDVDGFGAGDTSAAEDTSSADDSASGDSGDPVDDSSGDSWSSDSSDSGSDSASGSGAGAVDDVPHDSGPDDGGSDDGGSDDGGGESFG